jgi:hypothetical protein
MILNKNKKGVIGPGFIFALFLGIVIIIFLAGGGASTIFDITKFLKQIPAFIWVILILILIFRGSGGKKK